MSKQLKAGLQFFIKKVEAMDDSTEFDMSYYDRCVIGKSLDEYRWDEREILRKKFGIQRKNEFRYFCADGLVDFLPHQQEVLCLFTGVIEEFVVGAITKQKWLKLAYEQLNKM